MKKFVFFIMTFCLMTISGFSFENCDDISTWEATLPFSGAGESASIETETTIITEGTGSIQLNYTYTGNQWHEARAICTFASPIDLSSALKITFDLYGDTTAGSDLLWYIMFRCTNGKYYRYVDWNGLGLSAWQAVEIPLYSMESNPYSTSEDNAMPSKVDQLWFVLQQETGNTNSGSVSVYIDNFQIVTTDEETEIVSLEDFEYTSDTEFQAAWSSVTSGTGNELSISLNSSGLSGNAMQMDCTVELRWYNFFATYFLPSTMDFSEYDFVRIWVKGQPAASYPTGTGPVLMFYIGAPDGNRMRSFVSQGAKLDDWNCYVLFLDKVDETSPYETPTAPFLQDPWDGAGTTYTDFSAINKMQIAYIENGIDASYTTSILIDKIELGRKKPPAVTGLEMWEDYR